MEDIKDKTDIEKVRDCKCMFFYIGDFGFRLYTDIMTKNGREYIYISDESDMVQREPLKGYTTIQGAKDAYERDLRYLIRETVKELKKMKKSR